MLYLNFVGEMNFRVPGNLPRSLDHLVSTCLLYFSCAWKRSVFSIELRYSSPEIVAGVNTVDAASMIEASGRILWSDCAYDIISGTLDRADLRKLAVCPQSSSTCQNHHCFRERGDRQSRRPDLSTRGSIISSVLLYSVPGSIRCRFYH